MINYIWIGFIVLAIGYGAYREITDPPPTEQPEVPVLTFEESTGSEFTVADDVYFNKNQYHKDSTKSAKINYELGDDETYVIPMFLPIPESYDYTQPRAKEAVSRDTEGLILYAYSDALGVTVTARFTDAKGNDFKAANTAKITEKSKWKKYTVLFSDLKPVDETAPAIEYPIQLSALIIGGTEEGPESGTLYLDQVSLKLPKIQDVSDALDSASWMGVLSKSSVRWAKESIDLAIGLIGIMMLWLGMMRIAEKAGLVHLLAQLVKPVMKFLFPEIPPDGDAMGAIVMNVAANMLGLGNAATPFGIKAMKELQLLNQSDDVATNAQCMLLAINTSSVTVIPITLIGYRAATGSTDLMAFWAPMMGATMASTICAVIACKVLEKLPMYRIRPEQLNKKKEVES